MFADFTSEIMHKIIVVLGHNKWLIIANEVSRLLVCSLYLVMQKIRIATTRLTGDDKSGNTLSLAGN